MIKTITKIGNSQGVIFDTALLELAHLKVGDSINVEIHEWEHLMFAVAAVEIDRTETTQRLRTLLPNCSKNT